MPTKVTEHGLAREAHEVMRRLGSFHRRLLDYETRAHRLGLAAAQQGDQRERYALKEVFNELALASQWLVESHLALGQPFTKRQQEQAAQLRERIHARREEH